MYGCFNDFNILNISRFLLSFYSLFGFLTHTCILRRRISKDILLKSGKRRHNNSIWSLSNFKMCYEACKKSYEYRYLFHDRLMKNVYQLFSIKNKLANTAGIFQLAYMASLNVATPENVALPVKRRNVAVHSQPPLFFLR